MKRWIKLTVGIALVTLGCFLFFVTLVGYGWNHLNPFDRCFMKESIVTESTGPWDIMVFVKDTNGKRVLASLWSEGEYADWNATTWPSAPENSRDWGAVVRVSGVRMMREEPCSVELAGGWIRSGNVPWRTWLADDVRFTLHVEWENTSDVIEVMVPKEESSDPMFSARIFPWVGIIVVNEHEIVSVTSCAATSCWNECCRSE